MKKNDCYKICHVADEWLDFTTFKNDIREMVGFNRDGWHLDKDILKKGNNVYSKETCCFVPKEINVPTNVNKYIKPIGLRLLNIDAKKLIANGLILSIRL